MQPGTWGEWVGAGVTAIATIVALYLGARNGELVADRARARTEIRALAEVDARLFDRLEVGLSRSKERIENTGHLDDDVAVSRYVSAALRLGLIRRAVAIRLLRYVYGRDAVWLATLDPLGKAEESLRRLFGGALVAQGKISETYRIDSRLHRALLPDAAPSARRAVRRAFGGLARI